MISARTLPSWASLNHCIVRILPAKQLWRSFVVSVEKSHADSVNNADWPPAITVRSFRVINADWPPAITVRPFHVINADRPLAITVRSFHVINADRPPAITVQLENLNTLNTGNHTSVAMAPTGVKDQSLNMTRTTLGSMPRTAGNHMRDTTNNRTRTITPTNLNAGTESTS